MALGRNIEEFWDSSPAQVALTLIAAETHLNRDRVGGPGGKKGGAADALQVFGFDPRILNAIELQPAPGKPGRDT